MAPLHGRDGGPGRTVTWSGRARVVESRPLADRCRAARASSGRVGGLGIGWREPGRAAAGRRSSDHHVRSRRNAGIGVEHDAPFLAIAVSRRAREQAGSELATCADGQTMVTSTIAVSAVTVTSQSGGHNSSPGVVERLSVSILVRRGCDGRVQRRYSLSISRKCSSVATSVAWSSG